MTPPPTTTPGAPAAAPVGRVAATPPERAGRGARPSPDGAGGRQCGRAPRAALSARTDEELLGLAGAGRADAFEAIYDRHAGAALALARRTVGSRPLAEDVVQEAFLSVWRAAPSYRPERGAVRAWMLTIVRNRAIDAVRRHATRERRSVGAEVLDDHPDARADTAVEALRRMEDVAVRAALDLLPVTQRAVIESLYFGGFSHAQVATALELPLGTVKGRTRLGLKKLREDLDERAVA